MDIRQALTQRRLTRRALMRATGTAALAMAAHGAAAQDDADLEARRKINLAGRQRMLSQRMSRAVLFASLDIERARHMDILAGAHGLFERTLAGLRVGDAEQGLPEEGNPIVLGALDAVDSVWATFGPLVRQIADTQEITDAQVNEVAQLNTALLFTSDNVVKALVAQYGASDTDMGLAVSINIAGRQRMLSQKMAKESALIAIGYQTEKTQAHLRASADLFDASLTALIEGLPTITLPPPPDFIRLKLLEVRAIWLDFGDIVGQVADTGVAGTFELFAIAAQADPLLTVMNEAVFLYEDV